MTQTRYIFRLDDITPTMDWGRFWPLLSLLQRRRIKPLLSIVPDNRDPHLDFQRPVDHFWETMRTLAQRGLVDFAQHGYHHSLEVRPYAALLRPTHGRTVDKTEFAGLSYGEQASRIRRGQEILNRNGIHTTYWVAPNHSFDRTTLKALKNNGFTAISDGISLTPYNYLGMVFVPQQLWSPRWMPYGVFTICLHTNEITTRDVSSIRQFLRTPARFTSFSEEANTLRPMPGAILNPLFKKAYEVGRRGKNFARSIALQTPRLSTPQAEQETAVPKDRDSQSLKSPPQPSRQDSWPPPTQGFAPAP